MLKEKKHNIFWIQATMKNTVKNIKNFNPYNINIWKKKDVRIVDDQEGITTP